MIDRSRWKATVFYRTENGIIDIEHDLEEIEDLQQIVERGPSFQAIEKIEMVYRGTPEKLTVEEADAL